MNQELPPELLREAKMYRAAVLAGVISPEKVVAWADGWLLKLDEMPEWLVDVSYSRSDVLTLASALGKSSSDRMDEEDFAFYMRYLASWYESHPQSTRTVTHALYQLTLSDAAPEDAPSEIYSFDDYLDLALNENYGTVEDIRKSVREFLECYAS